MNTEVGRHILGSSLHLLSVTIPSDHFEQWQYFLAAIFLSLCICLVGGRKIGPPIFIIGIFLLLGPCWTGYVMPRMHGRPFFQWRPLTAAEKQRIADHKAQLAAKAKIFITPPAYAAYCSTDQMLWSESEKDKGHPSAFIVTDSSMPVGKWDDQHIYGRCMDYIGQTMYFQRTNQKMQKVAMPGFQLPFGPPQLEAMFAYLRLIDPHNQGNYEHAFLVWKGEN